MLLQQQGARPFGGAPPHRPFPRSPSHGGGQAACGVRRAGRRRTVALFATAQDGLAPSMFAQDSLSSRFQTQVEIAYLRRFKRTATDCTALPCAASPRPSDARASASPAPPYARTDASRGSDRLRPRHRGAVWVSARASELRHEIAFQRIVADYCCDDDARSHGVNPTKLSSISPPPIPVLALVITAHCPGTTCHVHMPRVPRATTW